MVFRPDFVVSDRELPDVNLVVEIKLGHFGAAQERQVLEYMRARGATLGMLISPSTTRLYRDVFANYSKESIERVGEFSTADLLGLGGVPQDADGLGRAVAAWLEQLTAGRVASRPGEAREAVTRFVVPVVANGVVSALR